MPAVGVALSQRARVSRAPLEAELQAKGAAPLMGPGEPRWFLPGTAQGLLLEQKAGWEDLRGLFRLLCYSANFFFLPND